MTRVTEGLWERVRRMSKWTEVTILVREGMMDEGDHENTIF